MPSQPLRSPGPTSVGADAAQADPLEGTPYRTVQRLGQGGMCRVLEAEHRGLGKRCVVKLLHKELAGDERLVKRLRLEAKSLAKVNSPHVVAVSDLGETKDRDTYVAMELLHGRTLRDELRERPEGVMPLAEAIGWTRQVLAGLAAAHRIKIIHRDIKLDNLFLCDATDGQPRILKVLDFGIAKWLDAESSGLQATNLHPHTVQGTFLGTPRYVAPEQAAGKPVDARADVYSVGLALYQLVAGQGPFAHHKGAMDLLMAQVGEKPMPPSIVAPQHIPAELEAVIMKAIAKDPANRFQSADEFSESLAIIASHLGDASPPGASPRAPLVSESIVVSSTIPQVSSTTLQATSAPASGTAPLPTAYRPTEPLIVAREDAELTVEAATLLRTPRAAPVVEEAPTIVRPPPSRHRTAKLAAFLVLCAGMSAAFLYAIVRLLGRG